MDKSTKTILLVEDEAITAFTEKRELEKRGYSIEHVTTGEHAVAAALDAGSPYDLILMDINLGSGIDGTVAAERILEAIDIPVVFLSSHTEPEVVEKTEKITSYGYVVKNTGITVLDASIKMALKLFEANREIAASRRLKRKMVANIGDVIAIIDRDGVNRYKSPNIRGLFGWSPDDLVGESAFDLVHPDDKQAAGQFLESIAAKPGKFGTIELRYRHADGRFVWIEITMVNLLTDPDIQGFLGNYHDVTARKHAEERMRILSRVSESESTMVVVTDRDRRTEWANEAFRRTTGYRKDEIVGRNPGDLLQGPHPDRELTDRMRAALNAGEPFQCQIQNFAKDGTPYWIHMDIQPVHDDDGRLTHFVSVQYEITEQKRVERNLHERVKESQAFYGLAKIAETEGIADDRLYQEVAELLPCSWQYPEIACARVVMDDREFPTDNFLESARMQSAPVKIDGVVVGRLDVGYLEPTPAETEGPFLPEERTLLHTLAEQLGSIAARKRAEREIQSRLSEKETLLKEVHHRIKNNMAQVESLLSLQANSTESAEVKAALQETISRVQSIRVLYEKLLIGKGYRDISAKEYLEGLIDAIVEIFPDRANVAIEKRIADLTLSSKTAIPVGIVLNEVLTNIFKYAFRGRDGGNISIALEKSDTHITLTIRDDGIGMDGRGEANASPGFGLAIVNILAEQLGGTYTIESDNGTKSVLRFDASRV